MKEKKATKTAQPKTVTVGEVSINLKPTTAEKDKILSIYSFVDGVMTYNDLHPNGNGFIREKASDSIYWGVAIVSIKPKFQFPVPIVTDENGEVKLYDSESSPVTFSKQQACLVLAKYYISVFSFYNAIHKEPFPGLLGFAFSQAVNWMNRLGGEKEMHRYLDIISNEIMQDEELNFKACTVLD